MEILKQDQYSPLPFEKQVCLIYAAVNSHFDDIEVEKLKEFEEKFYEYLENYGKDLIEKIKSSGAINDESEQKLKEVIRAFKKRM